ncbi:hypothetical protein CLOP_g10904 [Closterium sp. NIES-67]|nr:hypothetical protein CLOP_g10904 [Closterium sp. NIES-67]
MILLLFPLEPFAPLWKVPQLLTAVGIMLVMVSLFVTDVPHLLSSSSTTSILTSAAAAPIGGGVVGPISTSPGKGSCVVTIEAPKE